MHALLKKPMIKARIAQLLEASEKSSIMSAEEILKELSLIGRTDIRDFHGQQIKDLTTAAGKCIKKIRSKTTSRIGPDGKTITETLTEIELWNKESALDMLGRHRLLFTGKAVDEKPAIVNITFTDAKRP